MRIIRHDNFHHPPPRGTVGDNQGAAAFSALNTPECSYAGSSSRSALPSHTPLQVGNDQPAHMIGVLAVSWAPAVPPGSLPSVQGPGEPVRRLVSCGCDNMIKVCLPPESSVWISMSGTLTFDLPGFSSSADLDLQQPDGILGAGGFRLGQAH